MLRTSTKASHSSIVKLSLECPDGTVRLAQVAPDWIIAKPLQHLAPCDATLVVVIDGREHRSRVRLSQGMSETIVETPIQRLNS